MSDASGPDITGPDMTVGNKGGAIGVRLSAAREKKNLEIEQVAKQLHLDTSIIKALEADDAAALPAAIFVQGYLRSYARLVGLPEEEIIGQYSGEHHELPPLSVVRPAIKLPMFRLPGVRLIRNIILFMLCLILLWLAYPFVERLISNNSGSADEQIPGRLELPLE